jgi:IS30 family transposase
VDSQSKCNIEMEGKKVRKWLFGGNWMEEGVLMNYRQLSQEERCTLAAWRVAGMGMVEISRRLGRHRSTLWRELGRNRSRHDGRYRVHQAQERTRARRSRSRRNQRFGRKDFARVEELLREKWSPEQIAGVLERRGELRISHETIYRHVWKDREKGGKLYLHLRIARRDRRKRYGRYDSRGRLAGKRMIGERPAAVEARRQLGHWEIDTMMGRGKDCLLTLVERKSGYLRMARMKARTSAEATRSALALLRSEPGRCKTITADNGTEFHGYEEIEQKSGVKFYFATPHHSWERGTNENTNGLIRQYLPKGQSMKTLTQADCDRIACEINHRPRKRHDYKTPYECYHQS